MFNLWREGKLVEAANNNRQSQHTADDGNPPPQKTERPTTRRHNEGTTSAPFQNVPVPRAPDAGDPHDTIQPRQLYVYIYLGPRVHVNFLE